MDISIANWYRRVMSWQPRTWRRWLGSVLRELTRDPIARNLLLAALFLNLVAWAGSLFVNVRTAESVIALHHNIYFGITLIGSPRQLFAIPLLGLCVIIANLTIARMLARADQFFLYIFSSASALVQFFLLLGIGSIILINFR